MPVALLPAAASGLLIGSFLNVVAYRLPRGESLATPGSRCPSCATPVAPRDNVPVLSWLLLRGRCRRCAEPIARRYPVVEALTAALFAAVGFTVVARATSGNTFTITKSATGYARTCTQTGQGGCTGSTW